MMKKLIGFCGIDCETCDARIATLQNDEALRAKTAKLWSKMNNVEIPVEAINCNGCRVEGIKTLYCERMCSVRQCALTKGFETCGDCRKLYECGNMAPILANVPEAAKNLGKKPAPAK